MKLLILFLFTLVVFTQHVQSKKKLNRLENVFGVDCEIEWEAGYSDGHYSDDSVDYGTDEILARISKPFCSGRLVSNDGVAYIPCGAMEYSSYEVLTNPNKCLLEWISINLDDKDAEIPPLSVSTGDGQTYVARGEAQGYFVAGQASITEGLTVVVDNQIVSNRTFDVLTSKYPLLSLELTDFTFADTDYESMEENAKYRLFAVEVIENDSDLTLSHHINHTDTFQEYFEITEKPSDSIPEWGGVSSVKHSLQMWFGSPTIDGNFDVSSTKKLTNRRDRNLIINKSVQLSNKTEVQVCSCAVVVSGYPVTFTAKGTYTSTALTGKDIEKILTTIKKEDIETDGDIVTATVEGTIKGRYVIRIVSKTSPVEETTPCYSLIGMTALEVAQFKQDNVVFE